MNFIIKYGYGEEAQIKEHI